MAELMKEEFEILDYSRAWKDLYLIEKAKLLEIFGENLLSIHHIGSTAIPNTKAKPEIDILIVVKDSSILAIYNPSLEELGYTVRGECLENGGTPGRYYYSKDIDNRRTHKIHVCQIGHPEIVSILLFVKYLNHHPQIAKDYASLKTTLSKRYNYGKNFYKYLAGKRNFIMKVLDKAKTDYQDIKYEDFT